MTIEQPGEGVSTGPVLTREGRRALAAQLERLDNRVLPDLLVHRQDPECHPSVDDDYHQALQERSRLEWLLAHARAAEAAPDDPRVIELGEAVTIALDDGSLECYQLVDPAEARLGGTRLSASSPLGRVLIGRRIGDTVEVPAPAGAYRCRVLSAQRVGSPGAPAAAGSGD